MMRIPWPGWVASTPLVVDDSPSEWESTAIGVRALRHGWALLRS